MQSRITDDFSFFVIVLMFKAFALTLRLTKVFVACVWFIDLVDGYAFKTHDYC